MGKKALLLICTFFLCIVLARTGTVDAGISTLAVYPSSQIVSQPGKYFTVNFTITGAPALTQWIVNNITWNPAVVSLATNTTGDIIEGPFLKAFGATTFLVTPNPTEAKIDEATCILSIATGSGGSGTLFTINFTSKAVGFSDIKIQVGVLLKGLELADLPNITNGTVTVVPEFPASMLLPLFLGATSTALIARTVWSRKRRIRVSVP